METEPKEVSAKEAETAQSSESEAKEPAGAALETSAESVLARPSLADVALQTGDGNANQAEAASGNGASVEFDQSQHQTIYRLLDEALDAAPPPQHDEGGRAYKHPLFVDFLLAAGLLVAMGGFTIGLMKIYIAHSAEQSISQRNFKAAIAILKDAPVPGLFQVYGKDPQELLNQALYLEAMEKLDANSEDESALLELQQITPGSRFFDFAQDMIKEHTHPSAVQLKGRTEHQASPEDKQVEPEQKIVIPPDNANDEASTGK